MWEKYICALRFLKQDPLKQDGKVFGCPNEGKYGSEFVQIQEEITITTAKMSKQCIRVFNRNIGVLTPLISFCVCRFVDFSILDHVTLVQRH